jgi:MerR family transcriptional regulator, light-induced transcriptional regulator
VAIFSIKDIEAVSGIRCHTLRIWEQRYGIITPKRTDSNIRYYDDEDLKSILNISILNKNGYKISEIAKLGKEEMQDLILHLSHQQSSYTNQVNELISSMIAYDEFGFNTALSRSILQLGLEQAMLQVVFPFLNEIGIMWQVGSIHPSHEHFATNIIKQKLYVAIDGNLGRYVENRKRFLLFLPENEQHSLGLLYANYLLRTRGHDVLFLSPIIFLVFSLLHIRAWTSWNLFPTFRPFGLKPNSCLQVFNFCNAIMITLIMSELSGELRTLLNLPMP